MSAQPPSGTVTFLVTGIEDATRLWADAPEDMATAVASHDAIVRQAIQRRGGYVLAAAVDGLSAAFASVADAVAAAVESQQELQGDPAISFAVRMALHTGEVGERDPATGARI